MAAFGIDIEIVNMHIIQNQELNFGRKSLEIM